MPLTCPKRNTAVRLQLGRCFLSPRSPILPKLLFVCLTSEGEMMSRQVSALGWFGRLLEEEGEYLHTLWGEDRGRGGDDTKLVSGGGKLEGGGRGRGFDEGARNVAKV